VTAFEREGVTFRPWLSVAVRGCPCTSTAVCARDWFEVGSKLIWGYVKLPIGWKMTLATTP